MLLRSSSTSVVQTKFSDSHTRDFDVNHNKNRHRHVHDQCANKISFIHGGHHLSSFSCNSPPAQISTSGTTKFNCRNWRKRKAIRRAKSDSNLEDLVSTSFDLSGVYKLKVQSNKMLYSEPSFSIYNTKVGLEEGNGIQDSDMEKLLKCNGVLLERSASIGDTIRALGSGEFSFGGNAMGLIEEDGREDEDDEDEKEEMLNGLMRGLGIKDKGEQASPLTFLVGRVGVDGDGYGGGDAGSYLPTDFDDNGNIGEYYRRMLEEQPSNPLLLRNYAQFLQSKGDLSGAEEYCARATLVDPEDGEILMQYAKLVWEIHHDRDKASSYFERAISAASEDSQVHAAYASFLWEIEESEDESSSLDVNIQIAEDASRADLQNPINFEEVERPASPPLHLAAGLGCDMAALCGGIGNLDYAAIYSADSGNIEEYYKRMVEENPCNPLFLRNYAEFLCQSMGDFKGAEEYYSRAILADPVDGEIISQYAKLVWQLYRDKDKALSYFQRAVQTTPGNSHVHAAYASFLWEIEESDEENSSLDVNIQIAEDASRADLQNPVNFEEVERPASQPLHLAAGLGCDTAALPRGIGNLDNAAIYSADSSNIEEYYKKMVEENPCNPLFLRNYAEFLCQSKGDYKGAEEYYSHAILADPVDGEIISQYAKLVWQHYRDKDKALSYFQRAVQTTPENSHVHAAYASFLWEIEESEEKSSPDVNIQIVEDASRADRQNPVNFKDVERPASTPSHLAAGLGCDTAALCAGIGNLDYAAIYSADSGNIEEYNERMAEENPCNPLFQRNYAELLSQSKGDSKGAEEYYSRAILADPVDGEIISQYAELVWQLYRDKDKALPYFQRAVQANPGNSNVLAAYARFLWEAEEDEGDDIVEETYNQLSTLNLAMPVASA